MGYSVDMADNDNASNFGALLVGLGVGLAVGFLLAPQSGEETREIIADRAKEGMARATEVIEELKMQVEVGLANAGEAVQRVRERVEDTVADAREKLQEAVREGQDAYRTELRERQAELESFPANRMTTS
jgi:gas vesicle protein